MTFDEACREAEDVEVMEEILSLVPDESERRELYFIHKNPGKRLPPGWSAVGDRLRPLDWFRLHDRPTHRYVAFLARERLRWAIRLRLKHLANLGQLDDPPEDFDRTIGELRRVLFKLRRRCPGDP